MSIESTLRKEGIQIIRLLDTLKVNSIAKKISDKLCQAFPEHGLNSEIVFARISRLNMYLAKFSENLVGAKYYYKSKSIYFNADFKLSEIDDFVIHECIHYFQEQLDEKGDLLRLGLCDMQTYSGMAINEASVQLMTEETLESKMDMVRYYDITLNTPSPNAYPLQCTLVNQMAYFTGTYPLYHSCLFSNDIFKNTFSTISDAKTYKMIELGLDKILELEDGLSKSISELQYCDGNIGKIRKINRTIETNKSEISRIFFSTQNRIISHCFSKEFHNIKDMVALKDFKERLYNYQNLIGTNDSYTFYNEFYRQTMIAIEEKMDKLAKETLAENPTTTIAVIEESKGFIKFFKRLFTRLGFSGQRNLL